MIVIREQSQVKSTRYYVAEPRWCKNKNQWTVHNIYDLTRQLQQSVELELFDYQRNLF